MAQVYGDKIVGRRDNQEDAFDFIEQVSGGHDSDLVMVVADGMGGHAAGEVASDLAVRTFRESFLSQTTTNIHIRLETAVRQANDAIRARIASDPATKGMGCTMVATLRRQDRIIWGSVGDSPLYLVRGRKLQRLNEDHSVYGQLLEQVERGEITKAEADAHPKRQALRSALTGSSIPLIDLSEVTLDPDDVVLQATDGLDTLPIDRVIDIVARNRRGGAQAVTKAMLDAVMAQGSSNQDNTTLICYLHSTNLPQSPAIGSFGAGTRTQRSPVLMVSLVANALLATLVIILALFLILRPAPAPIVEERHQNSAARDLIDQHNADGNNAVIDDSVIAPETQPKGEDEKAASPEVTVPDNGNLPPAEYAPEEDLEKAQEEDFPTEGDDNVESGASE